MLINKLLNKWSGEKSQQLITTEERNEWQEMLLLHETTFSPFISIGTERDIVRKIKTETNLHNLNNITRTKAYLNYFLKNPEVHWALLAHLVSRNGGWAMTDLKGDLVGDLLKDGKKSSFFNFLETANANIFHDAYPQLLLYEVSKQLNKPLFHLLPIFHVSRFMMPAWELFWINRERKELITVAMIINEQHYIEKRVIKNTKISKPVIESYSFIIQDMLGFTEVLFPYLHSARVKLVGVPIHQFKDVENRILTGKLLYSILLNNKVRKSILEFANNHPHTGSRADYWKKIFTVNKSESNLIYSPTLTSSWVNMKHKFSGYSDWFRDIEVIDLLSVTTKSKNFDRTTEHFHKILSLKTIDLLKYALYD
ncbi:DUF2515 domain-containing protein [Bacillus sp. HMF5848]|uniref:DUF2515 family protein n=1 Tax=Bacillus sp. HMF5848 TaxID=2495421 RepID=UPI000F7796E1|nr:DUF2515 family protein [Bacillus sp. HMF5848]RSK27275.1 DUF2515 domain-containing protein [Bacillus sp. HMF5848]